MNREHELTKLGAHIRALRLNKNMTQTQLAKACALDRNYISMLERGERNPTYITLLNLAKGLGMPVAKIVIA